MWKPTLQWTWLWLVEWCRTAANVERVHLFDMSVWTLVWFSSIQLYLYSSESQQELLHIEQFRTRLSLHREPTVPPWGRHLEQNPALGGWLSPSTGGWTMEVIFFGCVLLWPLYISSYASVAVFSSEVIVTPAWGCCFRGQRKHGGTITVSARQDQNRLPDSRLQLVKVTHGERIVCTRLPPQ